MPFGLHSITVTSESGAFPSVVTTVEKEVVAGFTLEESLGDQNQILAGDLEIMHTAPLPRHLVIAPVLKFYLIVTLGTDYDTSPIYNVYEIPQAGFDEYDYKTGLYKTRLKSITTRFFEAIAETSVQYTADTNHANYALLNARYNLKQIKLSVPNVSALNVVGFSLSKAILNLAGMNFGNYFRIGAVDLDGLAVPNSPGVMMLFRGASFSTEFTTAQDQINGTFYQNPQTETFYNTTWHNLLDIAVFANNGFIKLIPSENDIKNNNILACDLKILPRVPEVVTVTDQKQFSELNYILKRFELKGVKLSGGNFEYTQGAVDRGNIVDRSINIFDATNALDVYGESLFWAWGAYFGGTTAGLRDCHVLDANGNVIPYFSSGLIEPFYDPLISSGDGLAAKIPFAGEKLFDKFIIIPGQITPAGDVFQITRLTIADNDTAQIEALKLDY